VLAKDKEWARNAAQERARTIANDWLDWERNKGNQAAALADPDWLRCQAMAYVRSWQLRPFDMDALLSLLPRTTPLWGLVHGELKKCKD
jgi:hypothetical protein